MNEKNINELIAALIAAVEKHEKQVIEKENKLIIKGLGISLEELQSRGDAQKELIRLHNDMYDAIGDLEARLNELED